MAAAEAGAGRTGTARSGAGTAGPGAGRAGADSGRRALELLFAFTEQRPVASVRELADGLGMPLPTAHRYVALLRDMGLIEERERGRYHLTMRVAALGRAARQGASLVDIADPYLRTLSEQVGETVLLVRLVGGHPVCVHGVEGPRPFRLSFEVGQDMPALRGASVRVLVASLSPQDREAYVDEALAAGALPPVRGRHGFLADTARAADRGWDLSHEEIDEHVWAASAAVREAGRTVAAVSVSWPDFRPDEARRDRIRDAAVRTAERISRALGTGS